MTENTHDSETPESEDGVEAEASKRQPQPENAEAADPAAKPQGTTHRRFELDERLLGFGGDDGGEEGEE